MSNKLKAITTKAKALYKTGKFAKWTDAIKEASKSIGATKKAAPKKSSYHKDTKSHNVNIRVISGKVGALPIDFKGSFLGYKFSIVNQYTLDGGVTAVFLDADKVKILELNGNKNEEARAVDILSSRAKGTFSAERGYKLEGSELTQLNNRVKKFIQQLNSEVKAYNSGKDRRVVKKAPVKITYTKTVKKLSLIDEIKTLLKDNKKILKGGYVLKPGNIRMSKTIAGIKKEQFNMINIWQNVYGKLAAEYVAATTVKDRTRIKKEMSVVKELLRDAKKLKLDF